MVNLAYQYWLGQVIARDFGKALYWIEKSFTAPKDSTISISDALLHPALLLLRGGPGLERDEERALAYIRSALDTNSDGSRCLMGLLHALGLGVEKDYQKAMKYFQSSKSGYGPICLGIMYENGIGVVKDLAKARECYSAQTGSFDCLGNLGVFYDLGLGVKQNPEKAKEYYGYQLLNESRRSRADNSIPRFNVALLAGSGGEIAVQVLALKCCAFSGYRPAIQWMSRRFASSLPSTQLIDTSEFFANELETDS
jgi:TPR repeat protein